MSQEEYKEWVNAVGKTVSKKSNKPFKSGEIYAVPTGICVNPSSKKIAYTFEDGTVVDCYQCVVK